PAPALARGVAARESCFDVKPVGAVLDEPDAFQACRDAAGTARRDEDAGGGIVGHDGVQNGEVAGGVRLELDADARAASVKRPDSAMLDGQRAPAVEHDAVAAAEADAFDGQSAQADGVARAGIDADAVQTTGDEYAGLAHAVVDDADRLGDGQRTVAAGIEQGDLAGRKRRVVRLLEGPARRQSVAS